MLDPAGLLSAYDAQLRTDAETPSALSVTRLGPLRLAIFAGGRGFVTYRDLDGADAATIARLVRQALDHYRADPGIERVEWKCRAHDHAPGLHDALLANGFEPDEPESIMVGEARLLAVDVPLPGGVTLRQITEDADVRAMTAMSAEVFGDPASEAPIEADALLRRLALDDGMELWVAEADGQFVSAGRLEPVPGSDFAGIWGGGTRPQWRGRGIYRALTAARARSALRMGKTLIHSDSTEYSRPILERSGLVKVSTTTPYNWHRNGRRSGMDTRTERLILHPIDEPEARRIRDQAPQPGDAWADDYPFDGDLAAIGSFLRATEQHGEQRPFGYYLIRRQLDGLAVGGVGFKGRPDGDAVEIGYGLAPSARGHGYATEAVLALLRIAAEHGVPIVRADTDLDNVASQRTLEHAGFERVGADSELCYYEISLEEMPALQQ